MLLRAQHGNHGNGRWRSVVFPVILAISLMTGVGFGQDEDPRMKLGLGALRDGIPEVAAGQFRAIVDDPEASQALVAEAARRLLEARVRAGQGTKAMSVASEFGTLLGEDRDFWVGQAMAAAGRYLQAAGTLAAVAADESAPHRASAGLTSASLYAQAGATDEARAQLLGVLGIEDSGVESVARLRLLELALSGDPPELELAESVLEKIPAVPVETTPVEAALAASTDFLRAKFAILSGDFEAGIRRLTPLAEGRGGGGRRLQEAARFALADALLASGQSAAARDLLLALVGDPNAENFLAETFPRLEDAGFLRDEAGRELLVDWAEGEGGAAAYARHYLGLALLEQNADPEGGIKALEAAADLPFEHPVRNPSLIKLAEAYAAGGRSTEALAVLEDLQENGGDPTLAAQSRFIAGLGSFQAGEFEAAHLAFLDSARRLGGDRGRKERALFNAALAALRGDDPETARQVLASYSEEEPEEGKDLVARLELERALGLAASRTEGAAEVLNTFLEKFGDRPEAGAAKIALAELQLLEFPPRYQRARDHLESARTHQLDPMTAERADYVAVWIAGGEDENAPLAEAAGRFLQNWPDSEHAPEVRMKLAEAYFRAEDFPNAQTEFELLAARHPDSPLAEPALFFAGRSALSLLSQDGLDRAIEIWGELVRRDGKLAPHARYYQAIATRRSGQSEEALKVLDGLLAEKEIPPGIRREASLAKGETVLQSKADDPVKLEEATRLLKEVLLEEGIGRAETCRVSYLLARLQESAGDREAALATCYEALGSDLPKDLDPPGYHHYFRTGFHLVSLLGKAERWEAAVAVAERMAQVGGDRSEEARILAERLRLEHFIWE